MSVNTQQTGRGNAVGKVIGGVGNFVSQLSGINRYKMVALFIWLGGVFTTSLVIETLSMGAGYSVNSWVSALTIGVYTNSIIAAFVVQFILTTLQAPIWQKKGNPWWAICAVIVDVLINAAVLLPLMINFSSTPVWDLIVYITSVVSQGGINIANQGDNAELALMLIGATIIAAAPEALWNYRRP